MLIINSICFLKTEESNRNLEDISMILCGDFHIAAEYGIAFFISIDLRVLVTHVKVKYRNV
jgi:hypothetical protein